MTRFFISLALLISATTQAGITSTNVLVTDVMMYAKNDDYAVDQCLVYVNEPLESRCGSGNRYVIKTNKRVGEMMCSFALSAFVANKKVTISSEDKACDTNHAAPFARYIQLSN